MLQRLLNIASGVVVQSVFKERLLEIISDSAPPPYTHVL